MTASIRWSPRRSQGRRKALRGARLPHRSKGRGARRARSGWFRPEKPARTRGRSSGNPACVASICRTGQARDGQARSSRRRASPCRRSAAQGRRPASAWRRGRRPPAATASAVWPRRRQVSPAPAGVRARRVSAECRAAQMPPRFGIFRKGELVLVDIAERDDARQDRRVLAEHIEEDAHAPAVPRAGSADRALPWPAAPAASAPQSHRPAGHRPARQ